MRKLIVIMITGFLLLNGLVVLGSSGDSSQHMTAVLEFSIPNIMDRGEYVAVKLVDSSSSFLLNPGKPAIPMFTKTFTFPIGTRIINVDVKPHMQSIKLDKKIEPSPMPVPLNMVSDIPKVSPDPSIYESSALYPSEQYSIRKGVGLKGEDRVVYLTVYCYSQYSPKDDLLYVPSNVDIDIRYDPPEKPLFTNNLADLLIITDEKFVPLLQPLIDHKNSLGIKTMIKTTQEIYPKYNGRDDAEDVKLAIADAVETLGIKYVLLFGGHKGQTDEWWVPVRYSHNFDGAYSHSGVPYDPKYVTDLYYADVFKYDNAGNPIFEDWDSNHNGVFAEYNPVGHYGVKDVMDFYPDVYVGRIPARYSWEAETAINKIITYETTASESWFKHAVVAGGDTSPPARGQVTHGIYEGEEGCEVAAGYLESAGFTIDRLYTSTGTFSCKEDLINAVKPGCGFVHVEGHGSPSVWGNFLPDAQTEEEFVTGFTIMDIRKFTTGDRLPIITIGGCHNAQFNVTLQELIDNGGTNYDRYPFEGFLPCDTASWWMLQRGGGSIASMGNTALGYGYIDQYSTWGLSGWLAPRFYYEYAIAGYEYLGEVHGQSIVDYINRLGPAIGDVNKDQIDRKTIEEWVLLGDPSLKIGGYGGVEPDDNNDNSITLNNDAPGVPSWDVGDYWRYKLTNVDAAISEIEGRSVDLHITTGDITLKVTDTSSNLYTTEVSTEDLNAYLDITFDPYLEGKNPISLKLKINNASIDGEIVFTQSNLDISRVNIVFSGDLDTATLLENVNMSVPPFILKFFPVVPITVNLDISFDEPYKIFDFPLTVGKSWPLSAGTISIDGTVESKDFKLLKIADSILSIFGIHLIPPEFRKYLPVIDISQLLEDFGVPTSFDIPEMQKIFRSSPFEISKETYVDTEAGTFDSFIIDIIGGAAQICYSQDVEGFVKIHGYVNDFIPVIDDIDLELVEYGQE